MIRQIFNDASSLLLKHGICIVFKLQWEPPGKRIEDRASLWIANYKSPNAIPVLDRKPTYITNAWFRFKKLSIMKPTNWVIEWTYMQRVKSQFSISFQQLISYIFVLKWKNWNWNEWWMNAWMEIALEKLLNYVVIKLQWYMALQKIFSSHNWHCYKFSSF